MWIDCREDRNVDPLNRLDEDLLVRPSTLIDDRRDDDPDYCKNEEGQRQERATVKALTLSLRVMEWAPPKPTGPLNLIAAKTVELLVKRRGRLCHLCR